MSIINSGNGGRVSTKSIEWHLKWFRIALLITFVPAVVAAFAQDFFTYALIVGAFGLFAAAVLLGSLLPFRGGLFKLLVK